MKSFSLIVPCYNVENYIGEFLRSVFENQYDSFELILVNDGSSDSTGNVIESFFNKKLGGGVLHSSIKMQLLYMYFRLTKAFRQLEIQDCNMYTMNI